MLTSIISGVMLKSTQKIARSMVSFNSYPCFSLL
jgi:hypothetical protein